MALYLGGMQSIPGELYEAAAMDGAGIVRQFFRGHPAVAFLTTIFFNLVLSVIATTSPSPRFLWQQWGSA
jgi:multiple sugar transport system permease protein